MARTTYVAEYSQNTMTIPLNKVYSATITNNGGYTLRLLSIFPMYVHPERAVFIVEYYLICSFN